MSTQIIANLFFQLFIVSISPDYIVATDNNYQMYVCPVPDHCDDKTDDCLETHQSFEKTDCVNCSAENMHESNRAYCDQNIPFDYYEYINTTFGYVDNENITANMMQILHNEQFSFDDYIAFVSVFSADCREYPLPSLCENALFLASNLDIALKTKSAK